MTVFLCLWRAIAHLCPLLAHGQSAIPIPIYSSETQPEVRR